MKTARREGFEIIEEFVDEGVSGTTMDRPGFNALLAACHDGREWSTVFIWDRSRFARTEDPREAMARSWEIEGECGKKIVFVSQDSKDVLDKVMRKLIETYTNRRIADRCSKCKKK